MKPIRLEMTAFGPYGGSAEVDFDALGRVGLFVVAGPTGSGKTSIFDAMSYALYGALPGERAEFSDLRSDHAAADVACEVVFEFSSGGQLWRAARSPSQIRAKKRGEGTTTESAKASLDRWEGDGWEAIESGSRAVTDRCCELVGLNVDQFQRVVLLPQGQFQQVLKAKSDERRDLLRTLFSSELYDQLEDKLKARAAQSRILLAELDRGQATELERAADSLALAVSAIGGPPDSGEEATQPEEPLNPASLAAEAEAFRSGPLSKANRSLADAEDLLEKAAREREQAEATVTQLNQRANLIIEAKTLALLADERKGGLAKANRSREADPISILATRVETDGRAATEAERVGGESRLAFDRLADGLGFEPRPDQDAVAEARSFLETERELVTKAAAVLAEADKAEAASKEAAAAAAATGRRMEEWQTAHDKTKADTVIAESQKAGLEKLAVLVPALETTAANARDWLAGRQRLDQITTKLTTVARSARQVENRIEANSLSIAERRAELDAADLEARQHESRQRALAEAKLALTRRHALTRNETRLGELGAQSKDQQAEQNRILEAFQASAAPRLAELLTDGEPCAVCGAIDHPAPAEMPDVGSATVGVDEVLAAQVAQASLVSEMGRVRAEVATDHDLLGALASAPLDDLSVAVDRAEADCDSSAVAVLAVESCQSALVDLEAKGVELDAERDAIGVEVSRLERDQAESTGALGGAKHQKESELADSLAAAESELERARAAEATLVDLGVELDELAKSRAEAADQLAEATTTKAKFDQTATDGAERAGELAASLPEGSGYYKARQVDLAAFGRSTDRLDTSNRGSTEASLRLAGSTETLTEAISKSSFASSAEAARWVLEPQEAEALVDAHDEWKSRTGVVLGLLATLEGAGLPDEPPNLDQIKQVEVDARQTQRQLAERATSAQTHLAGALRSLGVVDAAESEVADQRASAQMIAELADTCAGKGPLRVSLEAWVLAAHLRDVVTAANAHLLPMSSGRYELQVAGVPQKRNRQGGLDLMVLDTRTGRPRPVASLSGGETFQASLSLALGLADVVTSNRGGIKIDALFVDEGFGSLDSESLDQAIGVLDGLRSRGSLVGIITHVDALKEALEVGIEIRPTNNGSELVQLI